MTNRYAIVENQAVINVVVADPDFANQQGWIECPKAGPGWKYINGVFVEPDPVFDEPAPLPTKEELLAQIQALTEQINNLPQGA